MEKKLAYLNSCICANGRANRRANAGDSYLCGTIARAIIRIGDKEVRLPEDAFIESMIFTVLPSNRYKDNPIKPPVAALRRGEITVNVELETGRTFLVTTVEDARREFQFLFDMMGEEMSIPIPADARVPDPTPTLETQATTFPR